MAKGGTEIVPLDLDPSLPDINLAELMLGEESKFYAKEQKQLESMKSNFEMMINNNLTQSQKAAAGQSNTVPASSEGGPQTIPDYAYFVS